MSGREAEQDTRGGGAGRKLADGASDGLEPLVPLDPTETRSADELLRAMSRTALGGRALGEAADLLHEMTVDPATSVVCTLSGAMTVAKMGLVLCRMIEWGMVQCVISTGALMTHGLTEAAGLSHYKVPRGATDRELYEKGYNRIYDTIEMEQNLNDVERVVHRVLERLPADRPFCSHVFCREVGRDLSERALGPGVLRSAFEHDVPVYIPAFTDSEIGLDVATWAIGKQRRAPGGESRSIWEALPYYNPFLDLMSYASWLESREKLGIFSIGGGVPRNWAQQAPPFYEIIEHRLGVRMRPPRFRRGIRICPEPVHFGGLSGCTFSEGVSWGKFVAEADGGRYAEVLTDATVAWPLLVRGVMERLEREGRRPGKKAAPGPAQAG